MILLFLREFEIGNKRYLYELIIKDFESNPETNVLEEDYDNSKDWMNNWYEDYTKGVILRSNSDWYELGEKSTKYFLNLERKNSVRNTVRIIFSLVIPKAATMKRS